MWWSSWTDVLRIVLVGAAGYAALVALLRVSGKRTLAKLNAFDFVVTIALGSTLATVLTDAKLAWSEGVAALALLVVLQLLVAFVTAHVGAARSWVTAQPTALLVDGEPLPDAMRRTRTNLAEVRQAIRSSGLGDLGRVAAVVLETDGTLSVIPRDSAGDRSALADLRLARDGGSSDGLS
ncbi:DUF421 domain-containing protein [Nocardioides deserti]|uniref:DUF421 domain-containing protein n=1 Tax=Nocardioides deserti TaxID=1588644 RepID=A0ABR6U922_9ACTN|nr:YetF domain-containing protein [Nocardioides deserti]MBC2960429.1 DUF421 domain-containing protein [Nocardioides deserti]GGO71412.1 DUF421 domain-containing protein [Nocardioides deserti]